MAKELPETYQERLAPFLEEVQTGSLDGLEQQKLTSFSAVMDDMIETERENNGDYLPSPGFLSGGVPFGSGKFWCSCNGSCSRRKLRILRMMERILMAMYLPCQLSLR